MKTRSSLIPQLAFWGICVIAIVWITATLIFETNLGWPTDGTQFVKRLVGWTVELLFVRALILGSRRYCAVGRE